MDVSRLVGDEIIRSNVRPAQKEYPVGMWEFNGDMDDPRPV